MQGQCIRGCFAEGRVSSAIYHHRREYISLLLPADALVGLNLLPNLSAGPLCESSTHQR